MNPVCPRCRQPHSGNPVTTDGQSACPVCPPQDASVLDFLWQFPRSGQTIEVIRYEDWFVSLHEFSVVGVHDSAWPTMYEGEPVTRIEAEQFPAAARFIERIFDEPGAYAASVRWSTLRRAVENDGPVRFFTEGIEVDAKLTREILLFAFTEAKPANSVKVEFVEVGVRFDCKGIVVLIPLVETSKKPIATIAGDAPKKDLEETGALLEVLDSLLN